MEILTDEKIVELLYSRIQFAIIGSVILISIGLLAVFMQTFCSEKITFKDVILPDIVLFAVFGGLGIVILITALSSHVSKDDFSVTYGYVESKNWGYKSGDSEERKYYLRIKGFDGKAQVSDDEYAGIDEGDKVIVVYKNNEDKDLLYAFDSNDYEYDGDNWVDP